MHNRIKLLTAALAAALVLSIGAGTAGALRSLSVGGELTLTLNSRALTFRNSLFEVIAGATIVKTMSRTIPKVEGASVGAVTEVRFDIPRARISGFGATRVNDIRVLRVGTAGNWNLFYKSILGTLPRINGAIMKIANSHILISVDIFGPPPTTCLYDGEIELLARLDATGRIVSLESIGRDRLEKEAASSGICSQRTNFVATGAEGQLVELKNTSIILI